MEDSSTEPSLLDSWIGRNKILYWTDGANTFDSY